MIQPTREELINFMKKHGAENVDSITDEQSAIRHFRAQSKVFKDERDEYKKQRDELIEDIAKLRKRNEELRTCGAQSKMNCLEDTNITVLKLENYTLRAKRTG